MKPKPRATERLALAPVTVSDRTAPLVLGLEPRAFRALVERERIPHATIARRTVCRVEDVLAALDRLVTRPEGEPVREPTERQPESVDAVLARIGKERVA